MPYSASNACSCFAAATASPRHAFSQPGFADAMPRFRFHDPFPVHILPKRRSTMQRGRARLERDAAESARKRATHPAF